MSHLSFVPSDAAPLLIAGGALLIGVAVTMACNLSRVKVMRVGAIAAPLALLAAQIPIGSAAALAASVPPVTYSRYVGTLSMYTMGCNQGRASDSQGQPPQIAILSFGDPGWNNSGTYGAWDNRLPGGFATISQIQTAVESYMQGFWNCTVAGGHSFMDVAPGVTNHGGAGTSGHGTAWGNMVTNLENWIQSNGFGSQLYAMGSGDLEPSWGPVGQTESWTNAFNATGNQYLDFGSADGCPPYGGCNNGWSQSSVYFVAWGEPAAQAIPEIFTESGSQANQWESISLWGSYHGSAGGMAFAAAMSQYQACIDVGSSCSGEDNTPAQSWTQLTNAMNSNSRTSTSTVGPIPYATEMSYRTS